MVQISSVPEVQQDQPWFLEEKKLMNKPIIKPIFGRLYKQPKEGNKYCGPNTLIGPEFIIRASEPTPLIHLGDAKPSVRRRVIVILLNGHKLEITCDPNSTTVSDIFQLIVQREGFDHAVTLGLSCLVSGDFVFPPGEKKLIKVAPQPWPKVALTLYLRFRLYLPSLRGARSWKWKHLLYLQVRRSLLERQLRATRAQLLALGGLALQAEFGDYLTVEKVSDRYFLAEHYLPENESGEHELELLHQRRSGLDPGRAEEVFISHCTSLPEYGTHYISACVINKEGGSSDVWLGVNSKGVVMAYKRDFSSSVVRQPHYEFNWPDIKKLSYSKHYFDITSAGAKYRLKLESNKSCYFFHLASLHHKFFMKLTNECTTLQSLSDEFEDVKKSGKKGVLHVSPDIKRTIELGALRRAASLLSPDRAIFRGKTATHCLGTRSESCRENRMPTTNTSTPITHHYHISSTLSSRTSDSSDGSRARTRRRPLMGTRAIFSNSNHDLYSSSSHASLELISPIATVPPYLLNTNIKCVDSKFHTDFQETISESLAEKFDKAAFLNDRILNTVRLERAPDGSLGLHVTEGKDGHVYILSTVERTPASTCGQVFSGDQIQAVNGISVMSISYFDVLKMIQNTGRIVELVLSQVDRGQQSSLKRDFSSCKVSQETGIDMIGVLQKGIEACYLRTIRYEIAPETDSDIVYSTELPRPISSYI